MVVRRGTSEGELPLLMKMVMVVTMVARIGISRIRNGRGIPPIMMTITTIVITTATTAIVTIVTIVTVVTVVTISTISATGTTNGGTGVIIGDDSHLSNKLRFLFALQIYLALRNAINLPVR